MGKLMVGLRRILPLCAVLLVLPAMMLFDTAFAQSSTVAIDPPQGPPDTLVTGTGANWRAGDHIQVSWDSGEILANTTVGSDRSFTVEFDVPPDATEGAHSIYFADLDSRYFLVAVFTVTTSTTSLTVQKVWTGDSNSNTKTSFAPGEPIRYLVQVKNPGNTTVTATFTFVATGPSQIFSWSGPGEVAPGTPGFYSPSTIPTSAPTGTYTLKVTVEYNGVRSSGRSLFRVTPRGEVYTGSKPKGKAPNLIVLVHGCCTDENNVTEDWGWDDKSLGTLIKKAITQSKTPGGWEIVVWDWHVDTPKVPNGCIYFKDCADIAYEAANRQGVDLAHAIARYTYKHVHLIAHSAGGKLIDVAAKELVPIFKNYREEPFIHLTFLDAYTPNDRDKNGDRSYGALPNYTNHYSEHYVDLWSFPSPIELWTNTILSHAFNFDITDWPADSIKEKAFYGHQWPPNWYKKSVTRGFRYGYRLSLEGSGKNIDELFKELAKYSPGEQCSLTKPKDKCVQQ